MTTDGVASTSTAANPISNRGFMFFSAAPCGYDATKPRTVADTLPPSAARRFFSFLRPAGHLSSRFGVYAYSHWESPATPGGALPEIWACLAPTPGMCYKRASEGLLEMGQPEAEVPKAQAPEPEISSRG